MKEFFLSKYMNIVTNNNPDFSLEKLEKIKYGIEGIYLTITKLFVVVILGLILGIIKDVLILLLFYNILRFLGFGYHAKTSKECLIFSILFFAFLPFLVIKNIVIFNYSFLIVFICIINFLLFAPSDTKKRPMFNKKKKLIRKFSLIVITLVYFMLSLVVSKETSSMILLSIIIQAFMVNPIIYMLTKEPYNNYKVYKKD